MAINKSRTRLCTLLEGQVAGDPLRARRIDEFDLGKERCTGRRWVDPLDPEGTNIGDMTAVDNPGSSCSNATGASLPRQARPPRRSRRSS